jgi:hypothetical protein
MKSVIFVISSMMMIAYVMYRGFTTFFILPLVASPFSPIGIRAILLTLFAAGVTVLSFTRWQKIATCLAAMVGLVALGLWFRITLVAPVWTRNYLIWFVLPEVCFSLASLCKWWSDLPDGLYSGSHPRIKLE